MNKSDFTKKQWQEVLNDETFHVTREHGTERQYSGIYWDKFEEGTYKCVCCDAQLFGSETKFDAGCGWPSFYDSINSDAITEVVDHSHGMHRIEVRCSNCSAHLGHIFPDGPKPTGQRYCINSVSMNFDKK